MRFVFKYPTRGRPALFVRMVNLYTSLLSRVNPVRWVVSIDEDDRSMQSAEIKGFIKRRRDMEVFVGKSQNKIQAINADFDKLGSYDVLVLVSDDMQAMERRYDQTIERLMLQHFPNLDGCLHFDDGLNKHGLNTMPIAGKKLIDSFGYIYQPEYIAEWCDNEWQEVTERDGKSVKINRCLFKHAWLQRTGKDETYKRNGGFYAIDKATFERRKAAGFP
jgi:hypothetical protein